MKGKATLKPTLSLPPKVWQALEYAVCVTSCWVKEGKVFIPPMDPHLKIIDEAFEPVWTIRGYSAKQELTGLTVRKEHVPALLVLFEDSHVGARRIGEKLATAYRLGSPMPLSLQEVAVGLLNGTASFPKPKAVKTSMKHRDFLLAGLANVIHDETGLPLASGEVTLSREARPVTASALVAAAFHAFGVQLSLGRAAKIAYNNKKKATYVRGFDKVFLPLHAQRNAGTNVLAAPMFSLDISGNEGRFQAALDWLESAI